MSLNLYLPLDEALDFAFVRFWLEPAVETRSPNEEGGIIGGKLELEVASGLSEASPKGAGRFSRSSFCPKPIANEYE
jgi:hypothetical protein